MYHVPSNREESVYPRSLLTYHIAGIIAGGVIGLVFHGSVSFDYPLVLLGLIPLFCLMAWGFRYGFKYLFPWRGSLPRPLFHACGFGPIAIGFVAIWLISGSLIYLVELLGMMVGIVATIRSIDPTDESPHTARLIFIEGGLMLLLVLLYSMESMQAVEGLAMGATMGAICGYGAMVGWKHGYDGRMNVEEA